VDGAAAADCATAKGDVMDALMELLNAVSDWLWNELMLVLLLGTGLFLTLGLKLLPIRKLGHGFRMLWSGRRRGQKGEGEITPFAALMTSLSATIGTGNIAGVGTAIHLGGPGAVFWMWVTALVGMATKFSEAVLAVQFREVDARGMHVGGPMYYIKNGLGGRWRPLAAAFALLAVIAAFGIGNTVQSNSVADALDQALSVPFWATGVVMAALVFVVIVGGIRRIATVAETLVPIMGVVYVVGALLILGANYAAVPQGIGLIFSDAFTGTEEVAGGFAGAGVMMAIQWGVNRGLLSNEAGLGSAPMAHAAARTDDPVRQGVVGMLGTFLDTIVVCTMTALVILTTGAWQGGETGAALTTMAFNQGLPGPGDFVVAFGLIIFAFSTTLTWAFYGERCLEYLAGVRGLMVFRVVWVAAVLIGAVASLDLVWKVAGITMALMAIPNLIALLLLSPVVFRISRQYFARQAG